VLRTAPKKRPPRRSVLIEANLASQGIVRARHPRQRRTKIKAVVAVNCGAIPRHLVEVVRSAMRRARYRGHRSATWASSSKPRRHAVSSTKSAELPLAAQVKLLRALQEARSSGRRPQAGQGRCPHHLGHQPQAARPGQERQVSRDLSIAARIAADRSRPSGAPRGHSASACGIFCAVLRRGKSSDHRHQRRGDGPSCRSSNGPATSANSKRGLFARVVMSDGDHLDLRISRRLPRRRCRTAIVHQGEPLVVASTGRQIYPPWSQVTKIPIVPLPVAGTLAIAPRSGEMRPLEEMETRSSASPSRIIADKCPSRAPSENRPGSTLYRKLDRPRPFRAGSSETAGSSE